MSLSDVITFIWRRGSVTNNSCATVEEHVLMMLWCWVSCQSHLQQSAWLQENRYSDTFLYLSGTWTSTRQSRSVSALWLSECRFCQNSGTPHDLNTLGAFSHHHNKYSLILTRMTSVLFPLLAVCRCSWCPLSILSEHRRHGDDKPRPNRPDPAPLWQRANQKPTRLKRTNRRAKCIQLIWLLVEIRL